MGAIEKQTSKRNFRKKNIPGTGKRKRKEENRRFKKKSRERKINVGSRWKEISEEERQINEIDPINYGEIFRIKKLNKIGVGTQRRKQGRKTLI